MRREDSEQGSGFASPRADAIARLSAAILTRNANERDMAIDQINLQGEKGNCPCSGDDILKRIKPILHKVFPIVQSAKSLSLGLSGDVEIIINSTDTQRLEIKALLEKERVGDITQSDWVRDVTDTLRFLSFNDINFKNKLGSRNLSNLQSPKSDFKGWDFTSLWLADIAGLTSQKKRLEFKVKSFSDLKYFLSRKYIMHLCQERDACFSLAALSAIQQALSSPKSVSYSLKDNKKSECAVCVKLNNGVVFTYHIYPYAGFKNRTAFVGRHKLHALMLKNI